MDPLDEIVKLFVLFKDGIPPGTGMVPIVVGTILLTLAAYMKIGKYHLDKAATLSQIGASAVSQLQANQKLTQEELAAARVAITECYKEISNLRMRLEHSQTSYIRSERDLAVSEARTQIAEDKSRNLGHEVFPETPQKTIALKGPEEKKEE
jgi:hypothetical protein